MAEYIKRESVINAIESLPTWWADEGGYYGGMQQPRVALLEPEDVINAINKIPSADVAEVVRCKDCKNNYVTTHNHGKQDDPRCDFTDRHLSLDDFCSRGERRMDGGT